MLSIFEKWLNKTLKNEMPITGIALNFNLYDNGDNQWEVELISSLEFDPEGSEWACNDFFLSDPLMWEQEASYEEIQKQTANEIKRYLDKGKYAEDLKKYQGIGIGFVDADLEILYINPNYNAVNESDDPQIQLGLGKRDYNEKEMDYWWLMLNTDELSRKKRGKSYIWAEEDNIDSIVVESENDYRLEFAIYGKSIDFEWPNIEMYYDPKNGDCESDYLRNTTRWPIVHKKVKNLINIYKIKGVKFYPINLINNETKEINRNYYLLFVENVIEAYDLQKSIYTICNEDNYSFLPHNSFLNKENCEEYDIFRPDKEPLQIIVSDRFRDMIEDNKLTGFGFVYQQ